MATGARVARLSAASSLSFVAKGFGMLATVLLAAGCSSDSGPAQRSTFLPTADIPATVAASGSTTFTEINVSVDGVTMFVIDAGQERSVLYTDGRLEAAGEPQALSSGVFSTSGLPLGKGAELVKQVEDQFPDRASQRSRCSRFHPMGSSGRYGRSQPRAVC